MTLSRRLLLLILFLWPFAQPLKAQDLDSVKQDLFSLYENTVDQEGMFYQPEIHRSGFLANTKLLNEKRLQIANKTKNFRIVAVAATNLAWLELENGNNEKALSYLTTALDARNQVNDPLASATTKLQIGFVNYSSLEYDDALKNFNSALKQLDENALTIGIPVTHALIGQMYLLKKDFDNAQSNYLKAYNGFSSISDSRSRSRIGVQLAEIAIRKVDYASALKYLSSSFSLFEKNRDFSGMAMVYRDYGIINFKKNDYDKAIADFNKSLAYSNQLSVARLLKDTYLKLYTILSLNGSHEKSNDINILYVQLRDSIDNVERSRVLNSQLTRRDILERESIQEMLGKGKESSYQQLTTQELEKNRDLTEAEIERLEKEKIIEDLNMAKRISDQANIDREEKIQLLTREKALQDLALSQKELEVSRVQTFRNTLIGVFLFIILIAGFLYNRYRNQKKSHEQIDSAYKELSETHHKLLSAQEQLVHAQKMASLGQLTAGIAHEIQNPLNFVNNFSEVSVELIDELNQPGVNKDEVLRDLRENLEKINLHGKRADKIVKGMLTHSRAGQADKQLSDINHMIDELLELSYHGNRSRDKNFTAEINKHLDINLPPVNIVTQDISRVLINLFNNAFYAVGQRLKTEGSNYNPGVGVSTFLEKDNVVIKIRDNGIGIPDAIKNKIFDPFFTTKPAGEGTGLGLSLSYDIIVKGHNGTLAVTSEANSFTEFIITLPVNQNA